ncbi:M56 family metallopeptidase [Mucilaginibacter sp.]|uniref:M56 family metallopeptidase n=1 Tax=Mucilaginibacter sp. TaxID=1882438 RepID=UPI0025D7FC72|nr:M56 family metallopeptidase [Mucilaginibacter sp.]
MQNILFNISQVLGITIIHSLWQGLIIYFVLKLALMFGGQLSASKKYLMATVSLLAITGWFGYTLLNEIHLYNWLAVVPSKLSALPVLAELPQGIGQFNDQTIRYYYSIEEYLPYITAVYIAGLLFNTGKLILARKKINAVKRSMVVDSAIQFSVNKFTAMLKIGKTVKAGMSKMVDVPCMVGYFTPVILLPFSLATYLSTEEIEAILLHELAHIKRNDYLVNMLQQVIAILLFFNPCAQLINRIINEERENCCDDLVVKATADPIIYAKALLKLEQNRQNDWQLALAATGKKYHLLNRIERIMKTKKQIPSLRPTLLAMLILTVGIGAMALLNPEVAQGKISVKAISPVISRMFADTGRKAAAKKKTVVHKKVAHAVKSNDGDNDNDNTNDNNNHNVYAYSGDDRYDGSWDFKDPELDRLSKEVEKHGNAIGKYYESGEFKKTQEELEAKGREMQAFYDKPELKELQAKMEKISQDFEKNWGETSETRELESKLEKLGKKIEVYYESPEFKKLNESMEKKYGIPHDRNYNDYDRDNNYRAYEAELKKNIPEDVRQAQVDIKAAGRQMRERTHSPEYEKQRELLRATGDSLRKAFHNPQAEQQKEEMHALSAKMRGYSHNPEIEKEKAALHEATAKLHAYMRTPDFKRRLQEYKKTHPRKFRWSDDNDDDKGDKADKPEKQEKDDTSDQQ